MVFEPEEGDKDELSLLTSAQTENYKDVKVNPELTEEQRGEVVKVLEEFQYVFTDVSGLTNLAEHSITLTTEEPIHSRPYSFPHSVQKEVEKELDDMIKLGIIEPSTSSYSSPIVAVRKPYGSNSFCVDFRKLHNFTVFDTEPMPQPEHFLQSWKTTNISLTFDFSKGYWQVSMTQDDKAFTAFVTHKGLRQFKVMPSGLLNAPVSFGIGAISFTGGIRG